MPLLFGMTRSRTSLWLSVVLGASLAVLGGPRTNRPIEDAVSPSRGNAPAPKGAEPRPPDPRIHSATFRAGVDLRRLGNPFGDGLVPAPPAWTGPAGPIRSLELVADAATRWAQRRVTNFPTGPPLLA